MAAEPKRKSREQEEAEAELRAIRAYERRMEDIAWKHEVFLPKMDEFVKRQKAIDKSKPVFELEAGE